MAFDDAQISAWIAVVGVVIGWALKSYSEYWSHRRVFDQRLRLEKEYQLYVELWEKLFEARRVIGTAISDFTFPGDMPTEERLLQVFNDFQTVVRRGEPFFAADVYEPARASSTLARQLLTNIQLIRSMERQSGDHREQIAVQESENDARFREFNVEFNRISAAIRSRVVPS